MIIAWLTFDGSLFAKFDKNGGHIVTANTWHGIFSDKLVQ